MIRSLPSFLRNHGVAVGVAALLAVIVACAWPGLQAPLFEDDIPQFEKVAAIPHWQGVFQTDAFQFFRPVKNVLFKACLPFRDHPAAIHWIGLAAYLAATLGVLRIASLCLPSRGAALLATSIWALSPSCVSTAIWLSCANISIGIAFAGLMFHFHEKTVEGRGWPAWLAAFTSFALALMCYESLIALPVLLLLRDVHTKRLRGGRPLFLRYGAYLAMALAFLAVRGFHDSKAIGINDFHGAFAPGTRPFQLTLSAPWFLWKHFQMWMDPFGRLELLGTYIWMRSAPAASIIGAWLFLGGLITTGVLLRNRLPVVSYGLLFFLLASIPAGNFLPGFNGPINDAYLSIPSIGLSIALAAVCGRLWKRAARPDASTRDASVALLAIPVLILAYRLPVCAIYFHHWAGVWRSPVELYARMASSRPLQYQLKSQTALLLLRSGEADLARAWAEDAAGDAPWATQPKLVLARIARSRDELASAEDHYEQILHSGNLPGNQKFTVLLELAEVLMRMPGRTEDAAGECRFVLADNTTPVPEHLRAVMLLADIYREQGNLPKAVATVERGLTIHPGNPSLLEKLSSLGVSAP